MLYKCLYVTNLSDLLLGIQKKHGVWRGTPPKFSWQKEEGTYYKLYNQFTMHYCNTQQSVKYLLLTYYWFQKSRCCHLQKKKTPLTWNINVQTYCFFCIAFVNLYFNERHFHLKIESSIAETNSKSTQSASP
jgi:hypothetical protein